MTELSDIVERARVAFHSGRTRNVEFRRKQLQSMKRLLDDNEKAITDALYSDLHKSKHEATILELDTLRAEVAVSLFNLDDWVKPEKVPKTIPTLLESVYIQSEPYGVVLVLGAWNYPLNLLLTPVVGAIAAGNCCIIKPSEISPATANLVAELVPKYLDEECFPVVCGGPEVATELLKERFDYVFYTGSTQVGRIVREAANKFLTPCTLEMGGKSPAYVADDCDFLIATKRLLWGKLVNLGQTCVAPDYVLCSKMAQDRILDIAKKVLVEWYGDDPHMSPDLGRMVNDKHFNRVVKLMQSSGEIALGGKYVESDRYIAPTILINVKETDPIMQEEIFGPVLPFLNVDNVEDAIKFINVREKPLAAYGFTSNRALAKRLVRETTSGAFVLNESVVHFGVETLPFGGVGNSGMGRYHGKFTFDTFSHKKACLIRAFSNFAERIARARYPPYSDYKIKEAHFILKKRKPIKLPMSCIMFVTAFLLGALATYLYITYND